MTEGLTWGNDYILMLSPAVLALVPGLLRPRFRIFPARSREFRN